MPHKRKEITLHVLYFTVTRAIINTSYRMVYPFLPVFAMGLNVDPASLGMALSIRSFLGVFGPFLASVADTRNRKTGMILGLVLFTLGSSVVVIWQEFWAFIVGISLTLIGNVVFIPSMNAFIGDRVPYEKRGRVLAIVEVSWSIAFIGGIPIVRYLLEHISWFSPFTIFAVLGLGMLFLLLLIIPNQRLPQANGNSIWKNLSRIISAWPALAGLLAGTLFTCSNEVINLIFGLWIEEQFGLNFATLTVASIVIGVSELGGEAVAGLWLDAVGKRRMIWIFLGANSLVALLLPLSAGKLVWTMSGLGALFITFEIVFISALTLMSEIMPDARATMIAATMAGFSLGRMLGDLIGPGLFGIGFWASCLAAVGLNLLAGVLLTQVRVR